MRSEERAGKCRWGRGARSSKREQICGVERADGRTRMHAPVRIKPLRLKSDAVASPALVLNRARFQSAVRVRAARLGVPVFGWIKRDSVQPKVRIVVASE